MWEKLKGFVYMWLKNDLEIAAGKSDVILNGLLHFN